VFPLVFAKSKLIKLGSLVLVVDPVIVVDQGQTFVLVVKIQMSRNEPLGVVPTHLTILFVPLGVSHEPAPELVL
jgi:hypothetical protein